MKVYKLEVRIENGRMNMESKCDGFNGLEVLGILQMKMNDCLDQLAGKIKPDTIKREVMVNEQGLPD